MKIMMVATDLDGTLLGGTEGRYGLLPEGIAALRKAASLQAKIAIVSGRDYEFIIKLMEREGIDYAQEGWPHYIIAEERCVYSLHEGQYEPDFEWNQAIVLEERQQFEPIRAGINGLLSGSIAEIDEKAFRLSGEMEETRGYVEVIFSDAAKARTAESLIEAWVQQQNMPYQMIRNLAGINIRHRHIGKGAMLNRICLEQSIPPTQVLAIGDSSNDLSMLDGRLGFRSACPGNAESNVKAIVAAGEGYTATGHYGLGVADAIEFYMGTPK